MSDSVGRVRSLLAEVDRVAAGFETAAGKTDEHVRDLLRELEGVREAERSARTRAERAEKAAAILREEREVIRGALQRVADAGERR